MNFAKIDFINLLPVHIFLKKSVKSNQLKAIIEYQKSYPSAINKRFKKRKVHSAFISSIASRGEKALDFGIIARSNVQSVLLVPGNYSKDYQSDTSNALAQVLNLEGQVIIGDKALKFYHENDKESFIDLAKAWQDKYNLPFVFARLCYNKHGELLYKVMKPFNKRFVKIPQYILEQYSQRSGVSKQHILEYLQGIDYDIGYKEKRALNRFFQLSKKRGL